MVDKPNQNTPEILKGLIVTAFIKAGVDTDYFREKASSHLINGFDMKGYSIDFPDGADLKAVAQTIADNLPDDIAHTTAHENGVFCLDLSKRGIIRIESTSKIPEKHLVSPTFG